MKKLAQPRSVSSGRGTRYFSEDFRRKKVSELEKLQTSIAEICRVYEVSRAAVYKWIHTYSLMKKKGIKMVVEARSDTARIEALQQRISELEQLLGQKQFEVEFLQKQMALAAEQYGVDFKKKCSSRPFSGIGRTETNTLTK